MARSVRLRGAPPIKDNMEETLPVFYCPYDLAIQTMNIIWESKATAIAKLVDDGFLKEDIDDITL
jgi:hypothetical protein